MSKERDDISSNLKASPLSVDLSSLIDFQFKTNWGSFDSNAEERKSDKDWRKKRHFESKGNPSHFKKKIQRIKPGLKTEETFEPTVDVAFYPQDAFFKELTKILKMGWKTYELFDIAHAILKKKDHLVVVLRPLDKSKLAFYISIPDDIAFEKESEAFDYVFKHHLDKFVSIEEVEIEPPQGTFTIIHKCGITGALLGPPNYHKYAQLLKEHFATKISNIPFERFQQKIESTRDSDAVQAWLEKMKKVKRYVYKHLESSETEVFESLDALKYFLQNRLKDKIVKSTPVVRLDGNKIHLLPEGNIRRSIEVVLEKQRRFPLTTANQLRGLLRRTGFSVYKKGTKGISYVCSVKRKFRTPNMVFSNDVQKLIEFLEKNPLIHFNDLHEKYLGIKLTHDSSTISKEKVTKEGQTEAPLDIDETASTQGMPNLEENAKRQRLLSDLRWLVSEGYVTDYKDGRLLLHTTLEASASNKDLIEEDDTDNTTGHQPNESHLNNQLPREDPS